MLFSGIPFLYYFLPLTLILYSAAPKRFKNAVLLIMSMVFYAWGGQRLVLLFAFSIFAGWLLGIAIEKGRGKGRDKAFMWLSVVFGLGFLVYFKYADFFISGVNAAAGFSLPLIKTALPIGISFYTLRILSYTIDVYRGSVPAQRNIVSFAAYVSFFPQLIAGPIVRYSDIAPQLDARKHSLEKTASGTKRFLLGLGKKVLLADVLGELCSAFRAESSPSVLFCWMYAVSYMLQIYLDFSGYSDMAIGLGRIFGFDFAENFDYPYMSKSITEFWRRWHISLGSWFRDYVYMPLGGSRRGKVRQLINIFAVWMLMGLWHGAAWNFVLWGLLYAVLLTAEKLGLKKLLDRHPALGHIYLLFTVMLGFVLFNAESAAQAAGDIAGMFAFGRLPLVSQYSLYCLRSYAVVLAVAAVGSTPLMKMLYSGLQKINWAEKALTVAEPAGLACILLVVTAYLVDGSFKPFLYLRF